MWSFFHGWRRKLGCVTLVMACVLAGLWMRSYFFLDVVKIDKSRYTIWSQLGGVSWRWNKHLSFKTSIKLIDWKSSPLVAQPVPGEYPYWPIVTPLTLLSAYLILWKPRKRKTPDQPTNPNVNSN